MKKTLLNLDHVKLRVKTDARIGSTLKPWSVNVILDAQRNTTVTEYLFGTTHKTHNKAIHTCTATT